MRLVFKDLKVIENKQYYTNETVETCKRCNNSEYSGNKYSDHRNRTKDNTEYTCYDTENCGKANVNDDLDNKSRYTYYMFP